MTTDITELALLVSKAKASVFTLEYISQFEPADIDSDDVDLRFEVDGRDTGTNVSIVDECGQAAKVIGALVEALEKAQQRIAELENYAEAEAVGADRAAEDGVYWMKRCKELESRTVKLPDGWQFEECEIEGCENGAIFSVGTGSRNIHLCDKCAHEPQNSRLKKSPLSKRLPFKMSAGIKVEAE
ncbi:TPA: hypothetical protein OUI44_001276 [Klebsiella quasipneumoniae]|nr:hypothetical protein [Klebsiella quasipneumoniae]